MARQIVQILALLLTVSSALALTCYKCDSSENSLCNYGIGSFTYNTVDCGSEGTSWIPKQCAKFVATDKKGNEYIARGCVPGIGTTACNAIASTLGFFSSIEGDIESMKCFTCDGDKCNSATKYTAYSMLGILLAALAFLF